MNPERKNVAKSTYGKLYIKKRTFPEWAAMLIFFWPFIMKAATELLGLPGIVKYIADAIVVYMLVMAFVQKKFSFRKEMTAPVLLLSAFFLYTLIVYVFNFQSPLYYLWGGRNNFRFYIAFFSFIALVKEADAERWLKLLDIVFWVNAAVAAIQFFILGVRQDLLGGILGISSENNGYTILFFCVIVARSLLLTFNGKEKMIYCSSKCICAMVIAAMAEMKFFFVAFFLTLILASVLSNFSWKKFGLLFLCSVSAVLGIFLLAHIFNADVMTLDMVWELATRENYSSGKDLNRLSAIPTLAKTVAPDFFDRMFGMGLGNCDTATFAICRTPFFERYSYLHYTWFSSAMLFLETGYVGLAFFIAFFVICFVAALKKMKAGTANKLFCQMAMVMSVLCLVIMFYNASLRSEISYMVYFILALPFISERTKKNALDAE